MAVGSGGVPALRESRQTVVGQALPNGRVCDELSNRRTDAGVIVERPHANADRLGMTGIRAEDRRATFAAKPLFSTVGRLPDPQRILTRDDPERPRSRVRLRRGRSTASPLTPLAVAIARPDQRRRDLVADSATITPTGKRKPHGQENLTGFEDTSSAEGDEGERRVAQAGPCCVRRGSAGSSNGEESGCRRIALAMFCSLVVEMGEGVVERLERGFSRDGEVQRLLGCGLPDFDARAVVVRRSSRA